MMGILILQLSSILRRDDRRGGSPVADRRIKEEDRGTSGGHSGRRVDVVRLVKDQGYI